MSERDLSAVLHHIGDQSQPLQLGELTALSDLDPEEVDILSVEWPTFDLAHRRSIARAMQEISEESVDLDFREAFLIMLTDNDATVREAAVRGLWEDTRRSTLRRLIDVVSNDDDETVRASAASTLGVWALRTARGELDSRTSIAIEQDLFGLYHDARTPVDVRRRLLETLGYLGDNDAVMTAIEQAQHHDDDLWQQSVLCAMGRTGSPRWQAAIEHGLADDTPALRYEAARAVGEFGEEGRAMLRNLAPLIADDDLEVALAAIWALGQVGGDSARRILEQLARETDGARQEAAVTALDELRFFADPFASIAPDDEFDLDADDEFELDDDDE